MPFEANLAADRLPFDLEEAVYLEITQDEMPLWDDAINFISSLVTGTRSLKSNRGKGTKGSGKGKGYDSDDDLDYKGKGKSKGKGQRPSQNEKSQPRIGLGWHPFSMAADDGNRVEMWALYQRSDNYTSGLWHSIVIFSKGPEHSALLRFCELAKDFAAEPQEDRIYMKRYDSSSNYWSYESMKIPRSLDSVVLHPKAKCELLEDLDWFTSKETQKFYYQHGIPYHRCYLFHGPPGAGKTSTISALGGYLKRHICFMQMTQSITDDTMRKAMQRLDKSSMLVLEDVDALFSHHRESTGCTASMSFSGFINCLDGLGAPEDVIVFMTSNHPERLDPAMLRPGRVDLKVEFKAPGKEIAAEYFKTFFPGADKAAFTFQKVMGERVASRRVSMAELQHFFLKCHRLRLDAAQAAEYAGEHHFEDGHSSTKPNSYS